MQRSRSRSLLLLMMAGSIASPILRGIRENCECWDEGFKPSVMNFSGSYFIEKIGQWAVRLRSSGQFLWKEI
ncbi:hypothetical protein M758_2G151800 [Ceratodon purpureus]|nr:hypothetical protein M758_2G151800 [Ceratodon purpureus]